MLELEKLPQFSGRPGPLLLIIMDGIGIGEENEGNAVHLANPKNLLKYTSLCKDQQLYCQLKAHGTAVGMPSDKDMGNSEVGHNALGAGKIIDQGSKLVSKSIKEGTIFSTKLWKQTQKDVTKNDSTTHLIGLLSDGNVHSDIEQLITIINRLATEGFRKVKIHILTDGRDVESKSALIYIKKLENTLKSIRSENAAKDFDYQIASGGGRMRVTMDRYESDWSIVQRGWYAHVLGKIDDDELINGYKGYYHSAEEAITEAREIFPDLSDQFLPPFVIIDANGKPIGQILDNDFVINFNFRGDRAIQISKAFEEENFNHFDRIRYPNVTYVGLTEYDSDEHIPKNFLVPPPKIGETLTEYCCANKIKEYAIAETHKYGHVTFFWNGNRSGYFCKEIEQYIEIESYPNEQTLEKPFMKAHEVCELTLNALKSKKFKFLRVNFANGDMVGHTGNIKAAIQAVKVVDECIGKLVQAVDELNGITIITADHGNCDEMIYPNGNPITAHSKNPVGFWIIDKNWNNDYSINPTIKNPGLSNVAATVLNLLGFVKPKDYRDSLLKF